MMPRGRVRSWTDAQLCEAVANSRCMTEVLIRLGLRAVGGNHRTMKRWVAELRLDTSHFRVDERRRIGRDRGHALQVRPLETIFVEHSPASQRILRKYALLHIRPQRCALCGNPGWHNGQPLSLQLDHINGTHDDNRLENLRWLCPNCHSQTPTFCGRSSRRWLQSSRPASE